MQKRRNDVKARTTLLFALPDEHQLRFSKYKTAQELWAAILKTFGRNEATKKMKKNLLKQQYGNLKVEGSETLEQTFNRLQAIVSHLEFMDIEIKQDDLNQKFLTSLALEWLMHTIVWRNRSDLDKMPKNSSGNEEVNTTSIPTASTKFPLLIKYEDINQIDEDNIEEMDIKAPRSQDKGRRDNYRQGSKVEEQAPKALMAIDGVGWDWSSMANEEENHAFVANEEAPTDFSLMAKSSSNDEENAKKEKDDLDSKLIGFQSASKDLDNLLKSQRSDKNKEGLGYNVVPPPPPQVYSPPKKDMSWTGLPEFADDTITDYSRPSPAIE
nr:ribonuclease H-like domain-containing protein [Tanacetum cinerariifolium]